MLLENIFATSFFVCAITFILREFIARISACKSMRYDPYLQIIFIASFSATIITAIMWIWRAWS